MSVLLAIVFGLLFGVILHKVGAANPHRLINMLRLKDFHLMKVIFFGIGFSSLLLFVFSAAGVIEPNFSVKTAYIGVGIGGIIFGIGWAISGFCPGTSIVGAGAGRKDALVFVVGGLVGAFLYMLTYGSFKSTFLFDKILGGKVTLADTGVEKYHVIAEGISSSLVAGGIAIVMIVIAIILPKSE
ncbi:MAG TPA: hypothetical protein EYG93_07615 [Sulfurospirillum arcachonense]|nr:hypothetical protein [Sulfurospirillum arcachonense]